MILRIIFDRANKGGLLSRRQIMIMGYFLKATENVRAMSTEDVNFGLFGASKRNLEINTYL